MVAKKMKSTINRVVAILFLWVAAVLGALVANSEIALAQTHSVLYTFCSMPSCADGSEPFGSLTMDSQGNLYGTTSSGGSAGCQSYGCGTLFKLTPAGDETVLYTFSGGSDASYPVAGVIFDGKGNLYGAAGGGAYSDGTVFEFAPNGKETVLHSFRSHLPPSMVPPTGAWLTDGAGPESALLLDPQGNLYGTTYDGGDVSACHGYGCGTVFEITATGSENVLYRFTGYPKDGANPQAALVRDSQGNLYGTTTYGGAHGSGIVFKITPSGVETVLYSFSADEGFPWAGLVMDKQGNLYGTTEVGGIMQDWCDNGCGTVFKIAPNGTETTLWNFAGPPNDGAFPVDNLILDAQGNLYGTTVQGGAYYQYGTVFKLTPNGQESVLYGFAGATDGAFPEAGLLMDASGNLYGTTLEGGNSDPSCFYSQQCGTVFKLTP
jgi:uncharacterized repeat protein (TIGR03803 family)